MELFEELPKDELLTKWFQITVTVLKTDLFSDSTGQ